MSIFYEIKEVCYKTDIFPILFFCIAAFIAGVKHAEAQGSVDTDREALVALYDATGGNDWEENSNWKSDRPLDQWYGVEADNVGRVTQILLSGNNLSGPIPTEIGNLSNLEDLWLSGNSLSGSIPTEIGNLSNLEYLWLSGNSLSGSIPTEIGNLSNLEDLWLYENSLSGSIPTEIGNLSNLKSIELDENSLSGPIPTEIGNLSNLTRLHLSGNSLSGSIPTVIGNLSNLEDLWLGGNSLSGSIPTVIGNLSNLEALWLYENSLSGSIPTVIGNLSNLEELFLNGNSLSGAIPTEIGNLSNLEKLGLSYNSLSGAIPLSFANLSLLTDFYAAGGRNNVCIPSGLQSWHNGISVRDSLPVCGSRPPPPTVSVTPETLSVSEGAGSAQLTLELSEVHSDTVTVDWATSDGTAAAGSDYTAGDGTVNFAPNETRKTIDIAITDDALDESDETFTVTLSNPSNAELGTAKTATVTIADNDTRGVAISPTTLTITEGASKTYEVVLNTQPTGDMTVTPSLATGSDADVTLASSAVLTFTMLNWDVAQTVTVNAAEDNDAAPGVATIEHAVTGADYAGVTASDVTVTEADNDMPGVTISPTTLTITEGTSKTYEVVLNTQPTGDVTVTPSLATGSDADVTLASSAVLTFTMLNWNAAQEMTVNAAEDNDAASGVATIEHAVAGADYAGVTASDVTVTEADNDMPEVTITPTSLTVAEGGSATYTVVLDTEPSADVTITVSLASGSDADITVNTTSLTFTPDNWDAAQEVTASAAEDDDAINGAATIEHAVSGGDYGSLTASSVMATESDNDERGVTVTPTVLSVTEGSNAKYTVVLDTQPSGDVTISVSFASGSDEDITVDKTSLTFTPDNWNAAQEVTVSAAVDNDIDDDAAVLNHKASGGDYSEVTIADVVVTVTDVIGGIDVSAWLARYSRVGADHLLSSVENRMESIDRGGSGAEASIAGQRIVFGDSPAQPGMELPGASAIWSASQSYTTSSPRGGRSVGLMKPFGMTSGLNAAARRYTNMTLRDALSRSAFRYARETSSGNSFGVWGQGSFSRFSGSESGADMDGDVMSGTVGIDNSFSGWLQGVAVSRSESEGTYRVAGKDSLSLSASLTGIYPYARYNLTDRLRVWGTGGFGWGSLRLQGDSLASSSSDLSMALGSIGVSGDIVSASSQGFGLSWQTDAMLVRSSLASSRSISSVEAIVHRLRLSLESSYILRLGARASFVPKLQLGVRRDGGDAEQGMGLDVAGGLGFVNSAWGLRAQVDMHGMLMHEDSNFEQWGVSGMILFDRSPSSSLGASLRLFPFWGSASSSMGGMRTLWSRETVSGLAGFRRAGGDDRSLRLAGRFDYGFAAFGEHGVASPYASVSVSGSEAASALAGADVEIGGGLGYSNRSLGLRMRAGMRGLMSEEEPGFEQWGASGVIFFDPNPSSPLGASFNVSQSWGITPRTGFGGSQTMGTMREREPLPRSVTGLSRSTRYGQPMRIEGEMGYGFSSSGGKGVATPYAGVAFSEQGRSGVLLGLNLQAGRRFLLNVEGSTPKARAISFDSMPEFRVRGLLKW